MQVSDFSFILGCLTPGGKKLWHPSNSMKGGPQSQSGWGGEEKNSSSIHNMN